MTIEQRFLSALGTEVIAIGGAMRQQPVTQHFQTTAEIVLTYLLTYLLT